MNLWCITHICEQIWLIGILQLGPGGRLKIAARVSDSEVPRGKPADWLLKDDGKYTVSVVPSCCLHVSVFLWAR